VAVLIFVDGWMLFEEEDAEEERLGRVVQSRGVAITLLGFSIRVDEFAMGLGAGLLRLPISLAVILIAAQVFLVAQMGMRLGAHVAGGLREGAERLAGIGLVILGVVFLIAKLAS
jgi:putative Mn2+ efflux pump MntP